jgi:nicotinic acid mononucleotide adenylyltransferase
MNDITSASIHQSDTYGVFIETGCGVPVSSSLQDMAGASKTIYFAGCPYSQDYSVTTYGTNRDDRAVSEDYVNQITKYYIPLIETKVINTIYVASFQIGQFNDIATHGWIALKYKDTHKLYHVSIRAPLSRKDYIARIGYIGIQLIALKNQLSPTDSRDLDIDIVLDGVTRVGEYIPTFQLMSLKGLLCFQPDGSLQRLETLCRDQRQLIVFKGSFNPPTLAHLDLATKTQRKYPDAKLAFMISINTVDKGLIDYVDLKQRIKWLTINLGYTCIVSHGGKFIDAINYFQSSFPQLELIFPVGEDTHKRMEPALFTRALVRIENFSRTEISSTRAREAIEAGDWATLDYLVPHAIKTSIHTP